jgi:hypothetical protein
MVGATQFHVDFEAVFDHPTRNINNFSSMAANNESSYTQVWDDSILVNSWDDALEEYKV